MQAFPQDAVTDGRRLAELVRRIAAASDRAAFAELFEVLAPRVNTIKHSCKVECTKIQEIFIARKRRLER